MDILYHELDKDGRLCFFSLFEQFYSEVQIC